MIIFEDMYYDYKLLAPPSFWNASDCERMEKTNGCGPKGAGWLVSDSFLGCCFTPACDIHDWMYLEGETEADKELADIVFLNNMMRIVCAQRSIFAWAQLQRAMGYYKAVRDFGHNSFWRDKKLII